MRELEQIINYAKEAAAVALAFLVMAAGVILASAFFAFIVGLAINLMVSAFGFGMCLFTDLFTDRC